MREDVGAPDHPLMRVLERLAHLLPAQGPISIFIHHNTLHAFEHLPFEEAVEQAAVQLGREPFLAESRYRDKLASGRIRAKDVDALLVEQLGASAAEDVAGVGSRLDLWRAVVMHGIPAAAGRELSWILDETGALSRFRTDIPVHARSALAALVGLDGRLGDEPRAVHRLWLACLEAVARADQPAPPPAESRFATATGFSRYTTSTSTPGSIRRSFDSWRVTSIKASRIGPCRKGAAGSTAAFSRSTRRHWPPGAAAGPERSPSTSPTTAPPGANALSSIANSLKQLGIADDEGADYLGAELLALRGWAGIVRQIEERPDRVPARDLTVTLRGYLAVRLLFERAALDHALRQIGFAGPLSELRSRLGDRRRGRPAPTTVERAWPLFHVAQLCGLDASIVEQWTARHVADLEAELQQLDGVRQRRILHQAFERAIRYRLYDALTQHQAEASRRTSIPSSVLP